MKYNVPAPLSTGISADTGALPIGGATVINGLLVQIGDDPPGSNAPVGAGVREVAVRYSRGASCDFANGTTIGVDAAAPYEGVWANQPANGTYTLVARAFDHVENKGFSARLTITINNIGSAAIEPLPEQTAASRQPDELAPKHHADRPREPGDRRDRRHLGRRDPAKPRAVRDRMITRVVCSSIDSTTNAPHPSSTIARLGSNRATFSPVAGCTRTISPISRICHSGWIRSALCIWQPAKFSNHS